MVSAGRFREDLYYRLNVLSIRVPALRDRSEDVAPLARRFAEEISRELGLEAREFTPATLERLARHAWPGNVRELRNVVERALVQGTGPTIEVEGIDDGRTRPTGALAAGAALVLDVPDRSLKSVERALIERVLSETSGNRSQAARVLGVNRATLYNKLRVYGLPA